jgi:hypothetical protein
MKNTYASSKGRLVIRSGIGLANYTLREEGKFQVRYGTEIKNYKTLVSAALLYEQLAEEASLWDMTKEPILVESKFLVA